MNKSTSALLNAYKQGEEQYKIGSDCFEEGYKSGVENSLENVRDFVNKYNGDIETLKSGVNELIDKLLKEQGIED